MRLEQAIPLTIALASCGAPQSHSHTDQGVRLSADTAFSPGPGRNRGVSMAARNEACTRCHTDIAAEWRESLHRKAHTDPVYLRAFAIEPMAFCQACHAPEADPAGPVPEPLADMGIGCVSCHVDDAGNIVTGTTGNGRQAPTTYDTSRTSPPLGRAPPATSSSSPIACSGAKSP